MLVGRTRDRCKQPNTRKTIKKNPVTFATGLSLIFTGDYSTSNFLKIELTFLSMSFEVTAPLSNFLVAQPCQTALSVRAIDQYDRQRL